MNPNRRPEMTPRSREAVSCCSLHLWGFQTSRRVVEQLGSDGAARAVAGSITNGDAQPEPATPSICGFAEQAAFDKSWKTGNFEEVTSIGRTLR